MNDTNFLIRLAETSDAEELRTLCRVSFYDTFVGTCSVDDMQKYLDKAFPIARINEEINSTDAFVYLIVSGKKICGYAKMGQQLIPELKHRKAIEIERLYILKEYIGKGLGNQLMQKCLETAKEKNVEVIYLGVWEHNYRAQKFYLNYNFEFFGEHPFPIESTPQTDLWMKKELV